MNRYFKLFFYFFVCALLLVSCQQQGGTGIEGKDDPLPVLQSMKIHGVIVKNKKVTVPNDKATVKAENIEATFDIQDIKVSLKNEPITLEAGKETLITISVDAVKGKHKALDIEVEVTREEKDDPLPVLQSMKIHGVIVKNKKVTVPNDKATVKAENIEATFDIQDIKVSLKNEPITLEAGKETLITISVDAVKGKHKALDIEVGVTREERQDVKLEVKAVEVKGGTNDWGSYSYGSPYQLTYSATTKYWEGNKPKDSDVLAFKVKVDKKDIDEAKITARLFQGTLKNGVVQYDTEKTKSPIAGTLQDSLLIFEFDDKNCEQISIKDYYKIEFFVDGESQISTLVKLGD